MLPFQCHGGVLHCEGVPLPDIAARFGTPAYVYSAGAIRDRARAFVAALAGVPRRHVAFAVKANPNIAVLRLLADEGLGADIVSGGELHAALAAGIARRDIVFSGTGKTAGELKAALEAGIGQVNLELEEEGALLSALASARGRRMPVVLRVNPDVDAGTHAKITTGRRGSKFGVAIRDAPAIYARLAAMEGLELRGVAIHIGSQLTSLDPLERACRRVGELVAGLRSAGHAVSHVDLGGGLGIAYRPGDVAPDPAAYGAMVARATRDWNAALSFEPGRCLVGEAGALLTEVLWVKPGEDCPFVVVDAAMNDLARPALYDAYHGFAAVRPRGGRMTATIVGPVCETGDTFATARDIEAVARGDLAIFAAAGAYGASMASTYNSRALVPEVLVEGNRFAVVADRLAPEAMLARQHLPGWLRRDEPTPCAA